MRPSTTSSIRPCGLGIGETRSGRVRWRFDEPIPGWRRIDPHDTGFVDLHLGKGLLGVVADG